MKTLSVQEHETTDMPTLVQEFRKQLTAWTEHAAHVMTGTELKVIVSEVFADLLLRIERRPREADELAGQIHRFLIDNLHRGPTLKDLAELLGYSEKYCSDFFRIRMGLPFSKYVKSLRVERAKCLLLAPETRVADVAEAVGFCDQFAFSHFFKKAVGCSPHHFRRHTLGSISAGSEAKETMNWQIPPPVIGAIGRTALPQPS